MKRIVLALCAFIALSSPANAARHYKCLDSKGNILLTDNPPLDATCESMGGERDLTPSEAAAQKIDRQTDEANRKIDRQIEEIDKHIYSLTNDPRNLQTQSMGGGVIKTGGLKKAIVDQIIKLQELKADIIMNAQRLDAEMRSPQDTGLKIRNRQYEMETKMNRRQRELESKTKEMEAKKDAMEVKMRSQESEIQHLEREKRMSEHNQRMQEMNKALGQ